MSDMLINGEDALKYGIRMGEGFISELLTPAPLKEFITNESRLEHGKQVLYSFARLDTRELNLTFTIEGKNTKEYLNNYNYFRKVLYKGKVEIVIPIISSEVYILTYRRCTPFALNSSRTFSKLTVRFEI